MPINTDRVSKLHEWKGFKGQESYNFVNMDYNKSRMNNFLFAQTTYINTLKTYAWVNTAFQNAMEHLILTQSSMKRGIRIWVQQGVKAIIKEMKQLYDREVV